MTSITQVPLPIVAALVKAEDELGANRVWMPQNEAQREFLRTYFSEWRGRAGSMDEIEKISSRSADVINRFLRDHGFTIRLDKFAPNEFGVAAVFRLLVEWAIAGSKTTLRGARDMRTYPAADLPKDTVSFYKVPVHPDPIVQVRTQNGDAIFMTAYDVDIDVQPFMLIEIAYHLTRAMSPHPEYGNFIFPMVDLNQEVDISWLLQMKTTDADSVLTWISQAKQQTKLKMNHTGALMESAAAIGVKRMAAELPKPAYTLDRPFLFWAARKGFDRPIFVAHVTEEDWKDPGVLK